MVAAGIGLRLKAETMNKSFDPLALSEFARHYGFHYDGIDPQALIKELLGEMERGLEGKKSSLRMIPSYITPIANIPQNKTVLALDAGGTNLRSSLVHFDMNGQAVTQKTIKTVMPGVNKQVNAEQFFGAFADAALPLLKETKLKKTKIEGIGFTFSYEIENTSDSDGVIVFLGKEVDAPEVIGKTLGSGLRDALAVKGFKYDGPIVTLNDTVATLLSGYVSISPDGGTIKSRNDFGVPPGPVIGLILGTGCNTAYPETNIPKINFNSGSSPQIVNCETGGFAIRSRGQLDMEYDSTTLNPGGFFLEKATSGAYLGPLTLHILKKAIKDKLIQFRKSDELTAMPYLDTKVLNEFIQAPLTTDGPLGSLFAADEGDAAAAVQYITSIITERAAFFLAAALAAIIERINPAYEPYSPVRFAVEGSTFKFFKGMRRALESNLHQMLVRDKPRPYIISPVEQASLFGAAVAALKPWILR